MNMQRVTQAGTGNAPDPLSLPRKPEAPFSTPQTRRLGAAHAMVFALAGCMGLALSVASIHVALAAAPKTAFADLSTGHLMHVPFTQRYVSQDIHVVNADGSGLTALTSTAEKECYPAWLSPGPGFEWPKRWLYLGAHGELLTPSLYTPPNRDELRIEPLDGGLALVHTGPKWSGTYAIVREDCKIQIIPPTPEGMDRSSAAEFWPYRDQAGHPIAPPHGAVIAAKHAVSPHGIFTPTAPLGWFFLCADGEFFTPEPGTPIHANAIWVVRKDDGLQFVRAGPTLKGDICGNVGSDRQVTLAPSVYQGPPVCWGLVDESGGPAFSGHSGKWFPVLCSKTVPNIILYPDGSVGAKPPEIP